MSEKNAARVMWLQSNSEEQTHLVRNKKRHLEELEYQDLVRLHRWNDTHKFYKKLNSLHATSRFVPGQGRRILDG